MNHSPAYQLSNYQVLMRAFKDDEPYNAVHFISLDSQLSVESIQAAIGQYLGELKLGVPRISNRIVDFPKPQISHATLLNRTVEAHATNELTTPFSNSAYPLRFFIINTGEERYLSITYDHWIADAHAIATMLFNINRLLTENPVDYQHLAGRLDRPSPLSALRQYLQLSSMLIRSYLWFAKAYRPHMPTYQPIPKILTSSHLFAPSKVNQFKRCAKAYGVTLNDVFIAALLRAFECRAPKNLQRKWYKRRRDHLVISVITNIRDPKDHESQNTFTLKLGFFSVSLKLFKYTSLRPLLSTIHRTTSEVKHKGLAALNTLLFRAQYYYWKINPNHYRTYHKNTPISVGLSNTYYGEPKGVSKQAHYIRYSPAGAMCPLVFNITNLNGNLHLTATSSTNRYMENELHELKQLFVEQLHAITH